MSESALAFQPAIPILRIFDVAKAMAFYRDYLGFRVDWEHRFADDAPLYCQMSRGPLVLHLSEHHGDSTPALRIFIPTSGLKALHGELAAKAYPFANPGIERRDWGYELSLTDPFGNRLTFCQQQSEREQQAG